MDPLLLPDSGFIFLPCVLIHSYSTASTVPIFFSNKTTLGLSLGERIRRLGKKIPRVEAQQHWKSVVVPLSFRDPEASFP